MGDLMVTVLQMGRLDLVDIDTENKSEGKRSSSRAITDISVRCFPGGRGGGGPCCIEQVTEWPR